MTSQKADNLLNLALDATQEEREKSLVLEVGFNPIDREWDLIIKYFGNLQPVRQLASQVVELLNEYAVVTIKESLIEQLTQLQVVEFVEKPLRLFFQVANGKRVSCINAVQDTRFDLFGQGTAVAVIDSGIDYTLPDFRNPDGTSRILYLWDQTALGTPPEGYAIGAEYTQSQINEALEAPTEAERRQLVPSTDLSGHGTAVTGIAAGNGRGSNGLYAGVAPQSELIIVKLGSPRKEGFPRTTELMQGIDYVYRKILALGLPLSVNISFGNTYGSHDGTSLLERYIDAMANLGRSCICVGTGNEARSAGHTSGVLVQGQEQRVELAVQERQTSVNVQIWKAYTDEVDISLISPSGVQVGPFQEILGPQRFILGMTEVLLYYGKPSPYSVAQQIFIDLLPRDTFITGGIWKIVLVPRRVVTGSYEMWLPSENVLNVGTGFLFPTENTTLTIPSTAGRVISVGAYNALTFTYADFSGRGFTRLENRVKPDIVAPGVNVTSVAAGGGYAEFTGTSFATPFVAGSAALLMQWGILNGNDPYLYGEKVKAYFRRGARPLPGFTQYPNPEVGFGALCVRESLPI